MRTNQKNNIENIKDEINKLYEKLEKDDQKEKKEIEKEIKNKFNNLSKYILELKKNKKFEEMLNSLKILLPIVLDKLDNKNALCLLEDLANAFGTLNLKNLSSSKLRKFYNYVILIDAENDRDWFVKLVRLKSLIYYDYGREKNNRALENLKEFIEEAVKLISNAENEELMKTRFKNFKLFFEAIVAYHKTVAKD
ncbi:type III-A CRISPR-associated protein Csm2 [Methanocaldococcus infernus]